MNSHTLFWGWASLQRCVLWSVSNCFSRSWRQWKGGNVNIEDGVTIPKYEDVYNILLLVLFDWNVFGSVNFCFFAYFILLLETGAVNYVMCTSLSNFSFKLKFSLHKWTLEFGVIVDGAYGRNQHSWMSQSSLLYDGMWKVQINRCVIIIEITCNCYKFTDHMHKSKITE